jgi:hypothetical protein
MRGTKAKQLRRDNPEPKVPQYTEPFMVTIKGVETHIPRRQKRAVYRRYLKMLRTGQDYISRFNRSTEGLREGSNCRRNTRRSYP